MKIVVIDNKAQHISIRPDNAILRNNDDFYMPHFSQDIVCDCGYIVRITRLAKCVAQKFASRCYDSITAGVTFTARDIMQQALESKLPTDEAYCFDHSTAIGTQWLTAEQIAEGGNLLLTTGDSVAGMMHSDLQDEIDRCVVEDVIITATIGAFQEVLNYEVLGSTPEFSRVRIELVTGRTHQIRCQFSSRNLPLVGDRKYSTREDDCEIALWSAKLSFRHPKTGEALTFTAPPPDEFPWNQFQ